MSSELRTPTRLVSRMWLAWCALFTGDCDLRPLGCFRVMWALCALFFTWKDRDRPLAFIDGKYHLSAFGEWWSPSNAVAEMLIAVAGAGAVAVLFGVGARLGAAVFVAAHGVLFTSDLLNFRNHVYLLLLTGAVLAISPAHHTLSLSSALGSKRLSERGPRWATSLLRGQFLVVYLWATINKLNVAFLDGWVLEAELAHYLPKSLVGALLAGPLSRFEPVVAEALTDQSAMAFVSGAAAALEAAVFVCLAVPSRRVYGVALGALLHVTIACVMNVFVFGALMMASYVLFTPPKRWREEMALESRPFESHLPSEVIEVRA